MEGVQQLDGEKFFFFVKSGIVTLSSVALI